MIIFELLSNGALALFMAFLLITGEKCRRLPSKLSIVNVIQRKIRAFRIEGRQSMSIKPTDVLPKIRLSGYSIDIFIDVLMHQLFHDILSSIIKLLLVT